MTARCASGCCGRSSPVCSPASMFPRRHRSDVRNGPFASTRCGLRVRLSSDSGHLRRTVHSTRSASTQPPMRVDLNNGQCGPPASRRRVMTVRNSSRPIARVFRATAAPGCRDELLQRFHSSSAALVNSKVGCLRYRILEPVDAAAPEVVFESIWRDLDAVKVAFGDAWQQSHLPEGYSALMTAYSVHHFLVSESSTTEQFASEPRT